MFLVTYQAKRCKFTRLKASVYNAWAGSFGNSWIATGLQVWGPLNQYSLTCTSRRGMCNYFAFHKRKFTVKEFFLNTFFPLNTQLNASFQQNSLSCNTWTRGRNCARSQMLIKSWRFARTMRTPSRPLLRNVCCDFTLTKEDITSWNEYCAVETKASQK